MSRRIAAALALLLVLSACEQTPRTTDNPPVNGGTLRLSVRDLNPLDPAKASGRGALFVLSQLFDSLTAIDESGKAVPAAAASWDTSTDGLTWTFTGTNTSQAGVTTQERFTIVYSADMTSATVRSEHSKDGLEWFERLTGKYTRVSTSVPR